MVNTMGRRTNSKMTGQNAFLAIIALAVVALVVMQSGILSIGAPTPTGGFISPTGAAETGALCQDDGSNDVKVAAKNSLNSSLEYQAADFRVIANGNVVNTGTGTAGSTLTYTTIAIPCSPRTGTIYALASADIVSAKGTYTVREDDTTGYLIMNQPDSSQAQLKLFDTTFTNTSVDFAATQTETTAVAMSAGDSRNGYLDIKAPTGKSQYGGPESDGILWAIDTVDGAAFGDDDIALSSSQITLREVDCDTYTNARSKDSADRCYTSAAIKASDGEKRLSWTMTNGGGSDAGASSDPILYVEDLQYYEENDGTIQYGAFTSGGTNAGESQVALTWANS